VGRRRSCHECRLTVKRVSRLKRSKRSVNTKKIARAKVAPLVFGDVAEGKSSIAGNGVV